MKYFLLFMTLAYNTALISQEKKPLDYVNPLIGTSIKGFGEGKDGGGTMPCVGPPFAMTNFVAQTRENKISEMPYVYEDNTVKAFGFCPMTEH